MKVLDSCYSCVDEHGDQLLHYGTALLTRPGTALQWSDMDEMETQEPTVSADDDTVERADTRHEAHEHAHKRLLTGVGAVVVLAVVAGIVWVYWGEEIHEACFGEAEACEVEISPELLDDVATPFSVQERQDETPSR